MRKSIGSTHSKIQNLLIENQKCIINTDIDGILTGLMLQNHLNWEAVGFCDSKDTIWIKPGLIEKIEDVIFLDIYVAHPNLKCIDQHIVAKDSNHGLHLANNPNKQNPNLERLRYASPNARDKSAYAWKYPFGTVHYIIACLEALGHNISVNRDDSIINGVNTFDLILRADDAARTTARNYRENALDWWDWLKELGGSQTKEIAEYCSALDYSYTQESYDTLTRVFRREYGCHTNDGNFSKRLKQNNCTIDEHINRYIKDVAESLNIPRLNLNRQYTAYNGEFLLEATYNTEAVNSILERNDLFSYAYTYCMGRLAAKGFSYTLWPPNGIPFEN